MSLTKLQVESKYPEVYASYTMQAALPESKYEEKMKFWETNGINCFERWTVPYFLEREKEKKRPCLRLNYPPDGKCNDCSRGNCRYDKICFMCGAEGHGAFQSYPGGKLKGELRCTKHRNFLNQLNMIKVQHGLEEEDVRALFKLPAINSISHTNSAINATSNQSTTTTIASSNNPSATTIAGSNGQNKKLSNSPSTSESNGTSKLESVTISSLNGTTIETKSYSASIASNESYGKSITNGNGSTSLPPPVQPTQPTKITLPQESVASSGTVMSSTGHGTNIVAPNPILSTSSGNSVSKSPAPHWLLDGTDGTTANATNNGSSNSIFSLGNIISGGSNFATTDPLSIGKWGNELTGVSSFANESILNGFMGSDFSSNTSIHSLTNGFENVSLNPHPFNASRVTGSPQGGGYGNIGLLMSGSGNGNSYQPMSDLSRLASIAPSLSNSVIPNVQSIEIQECDEYANVGLTLRFAVSSMMKDESYGGGILTCKGTIVSCRGSDEVLIRAWKKSNVNMDAMALRSEIKSLRILSCKCVFISKICHMGGLDIPISSVTAGGGGSGAGSVGYSMGDLISIVSEFSEFGHLDRFMQTYLSNGISVPDLQCMCIQLVDALLACHEMNIRHRDIRPSNVLVMPCGDKYLPKQCVMGGSTGFIVKLSNFTPIALLPNTMAGIPIVSTPNSSPPHNDLTHPDTLIDKWCAPEIDADIRKTGHRYSPMSDLWSLGLTLYYIATHGQTLFESHKQACEVSAPASDSAFRRSLLEKHGLHEQSPMLYDIIERMTRTIYSRAELKYIRCHPYFWTFETRKSMLIGFANASLIRGSDIINEFFTTLDNVCPLYVFEQEGWVAKMTPNLVNLVHPPTLRSDFWWSGRYLLQAIKNQLLFPESLRNVYPRLTPRQAVNAYLRQITDVDFPRLLILLFELGSISGKWVWDGDEVSHMWNN